MTTNPQTNSMNQAKGGSNPSEKPITPGSEHRSKHKGGRPPKPKEEQLANFVKVYLDDQSFAMVKRIARRTKKNYSTICRELILNGYTVDPVTKEQTSYIRKLAGMSNNLNQLAHESHIQFSEDLARRMEELAKQIDEVLIWFSDKITHG